MYKVLKLMHIYLYFIYSYTYTQIIFLDKINQEKKITAKHKHNITFLLLWATREVVARSQGLFTMKSN